MNRLCERFATDEFAGIPLEAEATSIRVFGDDVEVHVEDGLICRGAVVLQDVVVDAAGDLDQAAGDAGKDAANRCGGLIREFV